MRRIDKPSSIPIALASEETQKELHHVCEVLPTLGKRGDKRNEHIKNAIYNGKITENGEKTVLKELSDLYKGKCAYCEKRNALEIEHYRPKLRVIEDTAHLGYYWLAYEWTNLVPACHTCNKIAGGKGNSFPIMKEGTRVYRPTYHEDNTQINITHSYANSAALCGEKPYLLHPEIDEPSCFFAFEMASNRQGIVIKGIDEERRGESTIQICNLNRNDLKEDRYDLASEIVEILKKIILKSINVSKEEKRFEAIKGSLFIVFQSMQDKATNESLPFTLFRQYLLTPKGFNAILIPLFPQIYQELIYNEFVDFIIQK